MFKFYSVFSNIKCQPSSPIIKTENLYDEYLRILKQTKEYPKQNPFPLNVRHVSESKLFHMQTCAGMTETVYDMLTSTLAYSHFSSAELKSSQISKLVII